MVKLAIKRKEDEERKQTWKNQRKNLWSKVKPIPLIHHFNDQTIAALSYRKILQDIALYIIFYFSCSSVFPLQEDFRIAKLITFSKL